MYASLSSQIESNINSAWMQNSGQIFQNYFVPHCQHSLDLLYIMMCIYATYTMNSNTDVLLCVLVFKMHFFCVAVSGLIFRITVFKSLSQQKKMKSDFLRCLSVLKTIFIDRYTTFFHQTVTYKLYCK